MQTGQATFLVGSVPHSFCTLPLPGAVPVIGVTQHVTTHTVHGRKTVHVQKTKLERKAAKRLTVTVRRLEFIIIWLDSLLRLRNICKI